MLRPVLVGLVVALVIAVAGCTASDTRQEPLVDSDAPGSAAEQTGGLIPPIAPAPLPVETLADGTHSVFGLRIPGGMTPVAGPHKVYRFEGTHSMTVVKRQVMRQVETGTIIEESTGFLIRKARVLRPVGEADPSVRLAVRIFRGRKGGATIDVWPEPLALTDKRRRGRSLTGRGGSRVAAEPPTVLDATAQRRRQAQRRATLEALEKLQRGEKFDQNEANNPLFY
jgi:hypothetical protein